MTSIEDRLRRALHSAAEPIVPDEDDSLDRIRTKTVTAQRRRRTVAALAAAAVIVPVALVVRAAWDDDGVVIQNEPAPAPTSVTPAPSTAPATTAPVTVVTTAPTVAPTTDVQTTSGTAPATSAPVDPPPEFAFVFGGSSDLAFMVDRFVRQWLGLTEAELGDFVATGPDAGDVPVHTRREDGTPGRIVSTLSLRSLNGSWYVTGARSDDIVVASPVTGSTVGSPVTVSGEGTGFENTMLAEVRDTSGGQLGTAVTIADSPEPGVRGSFTVDVEWVGPASASGAVIVRADVGGSFATPAFVVVPVTLTPG